MMSKISNYVSSLPYTMNKLIFPTVFCSLFAFTNLYAQSTLSPYSLFGIGEIDLGNHGASNGMAGLGIGLRQDNVINSANPAALSSIRSKVFALDMAFSGKTAWYTGQGRKELSGTGNFDWLAVGFRPAKPWALSVGVMPISTVGYNIRKMTQVEGSNERIENVFTGEGGLSKIYLSTAIDLTHNLSLGISGSVVWGEITHTEQSDYWSTTKESRSNSKPCFDFGLQYSKLLNDKLFFTIGATAGYKTALLFHNTTATYDNAGEQVVDKVNPSTKQYIPGFYGMGFSFTTRKMVVGLDYLFQVWSGIESGSKVVTYKNMNKWTMGVSYTPNALYDIRKYWRNISYQFGASINDSYLRVSGSSGLNYRFTYGMVFPLKNNRSSIYFGMEYGHNAFPVQNRYSIRENYFKLTIGFSLKDIWFIRYKFD